MQEIELRLQVTDLGCCFSELVKFSWGIWGNTPGAAAVMVEVDRQHVLCELQRSPNNDNSQQNHPLISPLRLLLPPAVAAVVLLGPTSKLPK